MTPQTKFMQYYFFCLNKFAEAGITNADIAAFGGYDKMKAHLHDNAASEYMAETGLPYTPENFQRAREHIAIEVQKTLHRDAEDESYTPHQLRR